MKKTSATRITDKELSEFKTLNQQYISLKGRVADATLLLKRSSEALDITERRFADLQNTLAEKYGEGKSFDLETGTIK